jgi:hypothetical protein
VKRARIEPLADDGQLASTTLLLLDVDREFAAVRARLAADFHS